MLGTGLDSTTRGETQLSPDELAEGRRTQLQTGLTLLVVNLTRGDAGN